MVQRYSFYGEEWIKIVMVFKGNKVDYDSREKKYSFYGKRNDNIYEVKSDQSFLFSVKY